MLKAENITKRYGLHTAVDDVSMTVPDDLVTVIVGESGSGDFIFCRSNRHQEQSRK